MSSCLMFGNCNRGWSDAYTQHGTFEKHNLQGGHLGEMNIAGQPTKPASSHKLKVK